MLQMSRISNRNKIIIVVGAIALLIVGVATFRGVKNTKNGSAPEFVTGNLGGAEVRIPGKFACLPFKNVSASNSSCVLGLQGNDNKAYALDTSSATTLQTDVTPADNIFIHGILIPYKEITNEDWKKYNIEGVIRVQEIYKNLNEAPETPFTGPLDNG